MIKNILEMLMRLDIDLALNLLVLVFLIVAILYAGILNYRLKKLRSNKDEVDMAIIRFDQAVQKAEESISHLKDISGKSYNALLESIHKAQALRDELFFLLERGDTLANKMEMQIRQSRKETTPQNQQSLLGQTNPEQIQSTPEEDNILKMLRSSQEKEDAQIKVMSSTKKGTFSPHSKAEESLLDMLRSAR